MLGSIIEVMTMAEKCGSAGCGLRLVEQRILGCQQLTCLEESENFLVGYRPQIGGPPTTCLLCVLPT